MAGRPCSACWTAVPRLGGQRTTVASGCYTPDAGRPDDARALAERLGGLPLALRLTGSYLAAANRVTLPGDIPTMAGFLHTMNDRSFDRGGLIEQLLLDDIRDVWLRSLDHLAARGVVEARPLLRLLAHFADAPVPLTVLILPVLNRSALFPAVDARRLRGALEALMDLSLVDVLRHDDTVPGESLVATATLHPLVRDASRLDAGDQESTYLGLAADLLHEIAAPDVVVAKSENPVNWPGWQLISPHAFAVLGELVRLPESSVGAVEKAALVAVEAGRFLRARGLYAAAHDELRMVAEVCGRRLGPEERTTLAARHHLGRVLRDQAHYQHAENSFREVLEVSERRFGSRDRATIRARHELARVLYQREQFASAEEEARRVLEMSTREFGEEDILTLASHFELARVLAARGKLSAARSHFTTVYEAERRKLGERHPDTLNVRHELARAAYAANALAAAESDLRDVRRIRIEVLGRAHPQTLAAAHDLALVLASGGRLKEAHDELVAVRQARARVLGAEHPDTRRSADELLRLATRLGA